MQSQEFSGLFISNVQKPKYAQIQDSILNEIRNGNWPPGKQIPTERKLAEIHKASIGTVRHALQALVDQGYLFRNQGRGTFVRESKSHSDSLIYYRFSDQFGEEISALTIKSLAKPQKKQLLPDIAEKMGLEKNQSFYQYDRIFLLESKPVVFVSSYLPVEFFPGFEETPLSVLDEFPLYQVIETKYSMPVLGIQELFSAVSATKGLAEKLNVAESSNLLRIEMLISTNRNAFYEYRDSYCITSDRQIFREWNK